MEPIILDKDFKAVQVMDTFKSLIWTDRFYKYGDFEVYLTISETILQIMAQGSYLIREDSEHAMIIESRKTEFDVETGFYLIVTGRSLESIPYRRIIWNQTNLNGSLQDGIEKLLNENIINPTDPKRKINNFIFEKSEDEAITSLTLDIQFTGDNLGEVIADICETFDIGYKITLNEQNQFVFKLYSGKDRSYDQIDNPYVVFSPNMENIINSNYLESEEDMCNVGLVAGEGEGSSRVTVTVGSTDLTGMDRREAYIDARDISSQTAGAQYTAQLQQRGNEKLAELKKTHVFDGQVETSVLYQYNEDFFMGDIVQLDSGYGITTKARVTEYIMSESASGVDSYPSFEILDEEQ